MKMTVKRNYLIQLKLILEHPENVFLGNIPGAVRYMVSMNYETARREFDAVLQAFPVDPGYSKFRKAREEYLLSNKIEKDEDFYAKDEDTRNAINEHLNALADEYREAIEIETELDKERNAFLDQEMEVDLFTVKPEEVNLQVGNSVGGWDVWNVLFNRGNGIVRP